MTRKRLWIALLAIPVCLSSVLIIGAQRDRQANAGGVIDPTCVSSLPCIEYDNNGTGHAIQGIALNDHGIAGGTKNKSTSASNGRAGIFGNDISTSGSFNSGVKGISTNGTGVSGASTSGAGVAGQSTNNDGVDGFTTNPSLTNSPRSGVFGFDESSDGGHGNGGVVGFSINGVGVAGNSNHGTGVEGNSCFANRCAHDAGGNAALFQSWQSDGIPTVEIDAHIGDFFPLKVFDDSTGPKLVLMELDDAGNLRIAGKIFTSGGCAPGCVVTKSTTGHEVTTYSTRGPTPSIEDFGEGQLVNGQAYVGIDPAFAAIMDRSSGYLVFITSQGDTQGWLYVTQRSRAGFVVREHGGRSSVAFDYRIVAKPLGEHPVRLQMITVSRPGTSLPQLRIR